MSSDRTVTHPTVTHRSGGRGRLRHIVGLGAVVAGLAMTAVPVFADGTETLGPPSIPIAAGTGAVAAGTGALTQPATIDLAVPASATVVQVIAYWEGHHSAADTGADDTAVIDGNVVTGTLIGGPTFFFNGPDGPHFSSTYRADVTALGIVSAGADSVTVSGLDFDRVSNGLGLIVIHDDGGPSADIGVVDGNDLAFIGFAPPLDTTVPQTFTFDAAPVDRMVDIALFASSVTPGVDRPTVIEVTTGGTVTRFPDLLASQDGPEWDTVTLDVVVPAGAGSITLQVLSADDLGSGDVPASLAWLAGMAVVPPFVPPTTEPPVTEPPVTDPPVTEPPVTEPPVTEPPVTEPPLTTAPPTTSPGTTTTSVDIGGPTTTTTTSVAVVTTTTIQSSSSATTTTAAPRLPVTGGGPGQLGAIGILLVLLGSVMLLTARRARPVD